MGDGASFVSGVYTTNATSIDGFGTVRVSQTVGNSLREETVIGRYTTDASFDIAGGQTGSQTVGDSTNIRGYATGSYVTTATYGLEYNNLVSQQTIGSSISYMGDGASFVSGVYTTNATSIDGFGTVRVSHTVGNSLREETVIGRYTTDASFDIAGGQTGSQTVGDSTNIRGYATGSYVTTATYG